eukprot:s676_g10.t1
MVAEPRPGAMMLPKTRRSVMPALFFGLLALAGMKEEHCMNKEGEPCLGHLSSAEKRMHAGSKGMNGTVELAGTADLVGNATPSFEDASFQKKAISAGMSLAISACDDGFAISACGSMATCTCCGSALVMGAGVAINACDVGAISACDGVALNGEDHMAFGPVLEERWNALRCTTPKEMDTYGSVWNWTADFAARSLACFGGSNQCCESAGLAKSCKPGYKVFEYDINYTQEIQEEHFHGACAWSTPLRSLAPGFYMNMQVEHIFVFIENFDVYEATKMVKDTLNKNMRRFCGLMSVERFWMSLLQVPEVQQGRNVAKCVRKRCSSDWIQCCGGMESAAPGQGEQAFLQQMTVLATAATNAATAAERALGAISGQSASSGSGSGGHDGGLQAAAKILRNPDSFNGEDPLSFISWKFTFCSWLCFGDGRFHRCLENLEKLGPDDEVVGPVERDNTHVIPFYESFWCHRELKFQVILDLGCVRSVCGVKWMNELLKEWKAQKRWSRVFSEEEQFQFGNMETLTSRFRVHFEAVLGGVHVALAMSVVPGECPPLLSRHACSQLGLNIDCGKHSVSSAKMNVKSYGMSQAGNGHYLLSLHEFSEATLVDIPPDFKVPSGVEAHVLLPRPTTKMLEHVAGVSAAPVQPQRSPDGHPDLPEQSASESGCFDEGGTQGGTAHMSTLRRARPSCTGMCDAGDGRGEREGGDGRGCGQHAVTNCLPSLPPKGKCLSMVKSFAKSKDGFRLWKALTQEFEPSTRQRSLALAQTLSSYPPFVNSKSTVEQILEYEMLVQQFEDASSTVYPAELKIVTLVRCAGQKLREYLQLTINDRTTYGQLKETMMSYDKACRAWTPESVLKSLQNVGNDQGPQPMEVDRVENKGGKGKKGESKDKGKGWWNYGGYGSAAFGRGRGRGKGRGNKGKGKGKQKGKGKSKNKDGGKKGKNKGKVDSQQCRVCWEYGHWARDCPNRMVQQVTNDGQGSQAAGQAGQAGQSQARGSPQRSYPPSSTTASTVRRIFSIPMGTPSINISSSSPVRMVSFGEVENKDVVILDSGSDVSLLPLSYGQCGVDADAEQSETVQLRDCQGSHLKVTGYRKVSLVVQDGDGTEAELEHAFLIATVKSCILSLGQLYQSGWSVKKMDDGSDLYLESPDQELQAPVFYQRNSLAMRATVCPVQQVDHETMPSSSACVRAIVELEDKFRPSSPRNNQWQVADGYPFMRCVGTYFVDPRPTWAGNFGYRTTLVQKRGLAEEDHGFHVVEVSSNYLELDNAFGPIPDLESYAQGEEVIVLTILSEREEALSCFGGLLDAGGYFMDEPYEAESPFRGEHDPEDVPVEGLEINPVLDEGRDDAIMGREVPEYQEIAPALREHAMAEVIEINAVCVTPTSSIDVLRTAGRCLGVSTSGSKRKIYDRIRAAHVHSLRLRALEAKSKSNHQRPTPPDEMAQRSYPTLQCDFYTVVGNLNVLIMTDSWTKCIGMEPLRNKLQAVVGGAVARFLGELGYCDKAELAFDSEPVLAAGMRVAQSIRASQGLHTVLQPSQMYHKGRTALAERSIQTVRAQGKALMIHLEEKMKVKFAEEHPLRPWAVIHGAWLLSRCHVASSTATPAFMSLRSRPYKGRVCAFGEEVFALDPLQAKYNTQWRRGI